MARDIYLVDNLNSDAALLDGAARAASMGAIRDVDWHCLYPLVQKWRDRCPLLWRLWRHQQGADADLLIEVGQLEDLRTELAMLVGRASSGELVLLGALDRLAAEACSRGLHILFVAD